MRKQNYVGWAFKFKKMTVTLPIDKARDFESSLEKAATKIYEDADRICSSYSDDVLVKIEQISKQSLGKTELVSSDSKSLEVFKSAVTKALPPILKKQKAKDVAYDKKQKIEEAKRLAKTKSDLIAKIKQFPLPKFINVDDLVYPKDDKLDYDKVREFFSSSDMAWSSTPMYHVSGFGWCVPVLQIKNGHNGMASRAYAVRLKDGAQVRVGNGPHVTATVTLYLHKGNYSRLLKSLKPLIDAGGIKANQTRDELSTRRMNSRRRKSIFGGF